MTPPDWIAVVDPGTGSARAALFRLSRGGRVGPLHAAQLPSEGIRRGVVDDAASLGKVLRALFSDLAQSSGVEVRNVDIAWHVPVRPDSPIGPRRRPYRGVLPPEMVSPAVGARSLADPGMEQALSLAGIQALRWHAAGTMAWRGAVPRSEVGRRVLLLDMGAGVTDWALVDRESAVDAGTIAMGGDHFTADLSAYSNTSFADAELRKRRLSLLDIAAESGKQEFADPEASAVLEARAMDLAENVGGLMRERGGVDLVLLTGGASHLGGLPEFLATQLGTAVRRGSPAGTRLENVFPADPGWSAIAGMVEGFRRDALAKEGDGAEWVRRARLLWDVWWARG